MKSLQSFVLPVKGLKNGNHKFNFELDEKFFTAIDKQSEIDGKFNVVMDFDKRDNMYILHFNISGYKKSACDRCLELIPIDIQDVHTLYIKKGMAEDEADVVYVERWEDELNVAKYIYDFTLLSFPLMHVYDCDDDEQPPCNFDMLDKWDEQFDSIDEKNANDSNVWDALDDLNLEQ